MESSLNVAVIGGGISGAVCASILARGGVAVTLFESGRGAGGRMSQRREMAEDGKELLFDHGAPYFTVGSSEVMAVVGSWEERGLVTEWKEKFGAFDRSTARFLDIEKIPVKGFSIKNSEVLSWAFCDSSKPGRNRVPINSECWVLHSTAEYAASVIARTGLQKPSNDTLAKVAEELFQEFAASGLNTSRPFFLKAHRWGSAFPAVAIGREDKCLWDEKKRLAICGDFCVSPNVEGAVISGMRAASKFLRDSNCL